MRDSRGGPRGLDSHGT